MPYGRPIEITDPQTARELDAFPLISLEILEGSLDGKDVVAYADYSINELRSIAKQMGIEKGFFMKKSELIKKLEEHYDS